MFTITAVISCGGCSSSPTSPTPVPTPGFPNIIGTALQ
jgi:hypothetical protein